MMNDSDIAQRPPLTRSSSRLRYFQFALLLLAAGAIYPLLYLRQNFETTLLVSFGITSAELAGFYSVLGMVYAASYLPSGWLADRLSPRGLIAFSLATVGGLGLWFSTFPGHAALQVIFMGWGLAAGLTFWASLLKGVKMLAAEHEQGRFFGILDGGRGLVEALLASLALGLFAYQLKHGSTPRLALQQVIYLYSFTCLAIAGLILLFLGKDASTPKLKHAPHGTPWHDLRRLLAIPQVWLMALIIFCGYQLFWATYSFSAYLQQGYGMSALAAGFITVSALWMRPIGGTGGGFLGDRYAKETVLCICLVLASLGLIWLIFFPKLASSYFLMALIMLFGVLTYAIRGLYWSLLNRCHIPLEITGLAIGLISVIGYLPDIFLPQINAALTRWFPGPLSFQLYFGYIALCGLVGAAATFYFKQSVHRLEAKP